MSAQKLRDAAKVLRESASEARAGRWVSKGAGVKAVWSFGTHDVAHCDGSLPEGNKINARYIAMVNPLVGLALADWLDDEAEIVAAYPANQPNPDAERIADLILGGAA